MEPRELRWTGERLVPSVTDSFVLEHLHRYALAAELAAGRDVLDIASGEGYGGHLLAARARSVVGVDISAEAIHHAQEKYSRPNLRFREGTCVAIPLPEASVDLVVSFETIEHILEHDEFLAEIVRVLRPGGQLLISTPDRGTYDRLFSAANPFHLRELSAEEFAALLGRFFAHRHLLGQQVGQNSLMLSTEAGPARCGIFSGDFESVEFSGSLPAPSYILALCSSAPLPEIPVGAFAFRDPPESAAADSHACVVQVFADQGGGYSETLSARQALSEDGWQTVRFQHLECLQTNAEHPLRIDWADRPALVEFAHLRLTREADGAVLYEAATEAEFQRLTHSPGVLVRLAGGKMQLFAADRDPQLYLPLLPDLAGTASTLEMHLRADARVPSLLRRFHDLCGENDALHAQDAAQHAQQKALGAELAAVRDSLAETQTALAETQSACAKVEARERSLARAMLEARADLAKGAGDLTAAHRELEARQHALQTERGDALLRERLLNTTLQDLARARQEAREMRASPLWRWSESLRQMALACRGLFLRLLVRLPIGARARRLRRDWRLLRASGLIERGWYFSKNPSARFGRPDPVLHYLSSPPAERLMPSPLFDSAWYCENYPDVAAAGKNSLVHYLLAGAAEGRDPNPLFDTRWYLAENVDVAAAGENPLVHYFRQGAAEGRDPNPFFDSDWYLEENPDVAAARCNPLAHYLEAGWREHRDPSPFFSGSLYLSQSPDVADAGLNPLVHFLRTGWREGRRPEGHFEVCSREREIARRLAYLNERAGWIVTAGELENGRVSDWDRFAKKPPLRTWRERMAQVGAEAGPVISIVMPVYRTPLAWLERAVGSVLAQEYARWELCIADDGSQDPALRAWLEDRARSDPRIRLSFPAENRGISAATNTALKTCTGDFVALLDHDDELTADALGEFAALLTEQPEIDAAYSDQDKIDADGTRREPFHKPAWSPVFFCGVMYVGHLLVVRRTLLEQIGGCDSRFDKVQDFEMMLRVSEATDRIRHIPKILYHWRAIAGSVAASETAKGGIGELQAAAVNAHLARRGVPARSVLHPAQPHRLLLAPAPAAPPPLVSIIIPTAADSPLLAECLASIQEMSGDAPFEILLAVRSGILLSERQKEHLETARRVPQVRVLEYDFPFNYSRVNNHAASLAAGSVLLFLNDDTRVVTRRWLEILLAHLDFPGVGVVGPLLVFPDGSVQHAGVVLGFRGTADHVMRGFPREADGYFGSLSASREVSAVTGACMMLRAATYRAVGGMRDCFATIYQDVDLCLRIRALGHTILYVANVELTHYESATRGEGYDHMDREILMDRWAETLAEDPCYNINFTRNRHDYTLRAPRA